MIEALAAAIARMLNRYTGNKEVATDFVRYRLAELLNGAIIWLLSLLIGMVTDTLLPTVQALIAFYVIRRLTGGFHLPLDWCAAVTTGIVLLVVHGDFGSVWLPNLLALVLFARFAETGTRSWIALVWVTANFFIGSEDLSRCFFLQALTIIPWKGGEKHVEETGPLVGEAFGSKRRSLQQR